MSIKTGVLPNIKLQRGDSLWAQARRRLARNKLAVFGLAFLATLALLACLAPWLTPYSYQEQNLALGATPPSLTHWLGTDIHGRDLLTRLLYGSRVSLSVGIAATSVSLLIGVSWGAIAGYLGGRVDQYMMRLVDILYALPFMIFIILLMVVFGRSFLLLFIAIGLVEWLTMARIVRAEVRNIKSQEYIAAAIVSGLNRWQVLWRHVLPNTMGPIIVYVTLTIPSVILLESFLSFLGLGIQPPASSWGVLIARGVESMEEYPWLLAFPGITLALSLFALNFLGDGLRDALDPRSDSQQPIQAPRA
ncbi:MAG: ABC transporter permease [Pseudomonadales bacterium]|nr:ABC transporter permease [Pseudomonadales bacterium]